MGNIRKIRRGEKLGDFIARGDFRAGWDALTDLHDEYTRDKWILRSLVQDRFAHPAVIEVANLTGTDLDIFSVVELSGAMFDPTNTAALLSFQQRANFNGIIPSDPPDMLRWAVLLEPLKGIPASASGNPAPVYGHAVIAGAVACKVLIHDQRHDYARPIPGVTDHLESCALGPAVIESRADSPIGGSGSSGPSLYWCQLLVLGGGATSTNCVPHNPKEWDCVDGYLVHYVTDDCGKSWQIDPTFPTCIACGGSCGSVGSNSCACCVGTIGSGGCPTAFCITVSGVTSSQFPACAASFNGQRTLFDQHNPNCIYENTQILLTLCTGGQGGQNATTWSLEAHWRGGFGIPIGAWVVTASVALIGDGISAVAFYYNTDGPSCTASTTFTLAYVNGTDYTWPNTVTIAPLFNGAQCGSGGGPCLQDSLCVTVGSGLNNCACATGSAEFARSGYTYSGSILLACGTTITVQITYDPTATTWTVSAAGCAPVPTVGQWSDPCPFPIVLAVDSPNSCCGVTPDDGFFITVSLPPCGTGSGGSTSGPCCPHATNLVLSFTSGALASLGNVSLVWDGTEWSHVYGAAQACGVTEIIASCQQSNLTWQYAILIYAGSTVIATIAITTTGCTNPIGSESNVSITAGSCNGQLFDVTLGT